MRDTWSGRVVSLVLLSALGLSCGCMMPMMGMHGAHDKEDSKTAAEKPQVEKLLATLRRVEELISTQRILASQLPESEEKRGLADRLDRMKDEVHKLVQSWEGQAKPMQDMG